MRNLESFEYIACSAGVYSDATIKDSTLAPDATNLDIKNKKAPIQMTTIQTFACTLVSTFVTYIGPGLAENLLMQSATIEPSDQTV